MFYKFITLERVCEIFHPFSNGWKKLDITNIIYPRIGTSFYNFMYILQATN